MWMPSKSSIPLASLPVDQLLCVEFQWWCSLLCRVEPVHRIGRGANRTDATLLVEPEQDLLARFDV